MDAVRFLRRTGFVVSVVLLGFFALFLAGETLTDPGGWRGIALVAAWAVPVVGGVLLGWHRPALAGVVFAALVGAVALLNIWYVADPAGWRSFEDKHGPIRAVIVFVLATGLAVHGLRRTGTAGLLLLVLGGAPVLASTARGGFSSLLAAATAPMITGVLYVASSLLEHRDRSTPGTQPHRPSRPRTA